MLIGAIGLLDLRLLGFARALPARALAEAATPIALAGFAALLLSGAVLFAADARALVASPVYLAKVGLIGVAGLNALAFRWITGAVSDDPPLAARTLAGASLALWIGVATLGRLIAYV